MYVMQGAGQQAFLGAHIPEPQELVWQLESPELPGLRLALSLRQELRQRVGISSTQWFARTGQHRRGLR
jgi:hypothetical protein